MNRCELSESVESSSPSRRAAVLTAPGRGAIAVIAVAGPVDAMESLLSSRWQPNRVAKWTDIPDLSVRSGRWQHEDVVLVKRSATSFELGCHGGRAAVNRILGQLAEAGFAEHATRFQTPFMDVVSRAPTARTTDLLLGQGDGRWQSVLRELEPRADGIDASTLINRLDALLDWAPFAEHCITPWHVAIAGPPNVGKSSLLNAIVGYQRAIVFDEPGTTRDVLVVDAAVDGWPMQFRDTAGLRETTDPVEREGVARARGVVEQADLVLWVIDASLPESTAEPLPVTLADCGNCLVVRNKGDLVPNASMAPLPQEAMTISAKTGAGLSELLDAIAAKLVPRVPEPDAVWPWSPHVVAELQSLKQALLRGESDDAFTAWTRLRDLHEDAPSP